MPLMDARADGWREMMVLYYCDVKRIYLPTLPTSAWKKQADLRYGLSLQKGHLNNENIIISQSL
jgi:hypothetical protein